MRELKFFNLSFYDSVLTALSFLFAWTFRIFKNVVLPLLLAVFFFLYAIIIFKFTILKVVGGWLIVLLFAYWLLSGFNFFLKRYRYGKFTASIQRFWKRAMMCFWIIEGFLFLLFFYYMLNSSQEPVFMNDQISLYNHQTLSMKNFIFLFALISIGIVLLNIMLIQIKTMSFRQVIAILTICTLIYVYFLLSEAYQFYYVVNFYDDSVFVFSEEEGIWELESDSPRTRTKNHFLTLTILAKFWHYIFIFGSWVFFVMKTLEYKRVRYTLLTINLQNYIIFYIMAWLCMYSWLKWTYRRFLDAPYYWFFVAPRDDWLTILISEMYHYLKAPFRPIVAGFKDLKLPTAAHSQYTFTRGSALRWFVLNLM